MLGVGVSLWTGRHSGGSGAAAYHADAVHFDGSALLARGAALTGATGAFTQLLGSYWVKPSSADLFNVFGSATGGVVLGSINAGGAFAKHQIYDESFNGDTLQSSTGVGSGAWRNILFAYEYGNESGSKLLINGVDVSDAEFLNEDTLTMAGENNFYFGAGGETPELVADVAEFYLAFGQFLDLTNAANVAKFIAGGKPVDLGADGSTPTGIAPTIFFSGNSSGFATNRGTGGAFSLTGSLTNASTSPSD